MEGLAAAVVLVALLLVVLLLMAFHVLCLMHLAAADNVRVLPKLAWAVLMVCLGPIGDTFYVLCQRYPRRSPSPPAGALRVRQYL
jgi:hypothetical protein